VKRRALVTRGDILEVWHISAPAQPSIAKTRAAATTSIRRRTSQRSRARKVTAIPPPKSRLIPFPDAHARNFVRCASKWGDHNETCEHVMSLITLTFLS
jgi:hypothetical protein